MFIFGLNYFMLISENRLFDCIEYQLNHFPKADMMAAKENGIWKKYSTLEISNLVNKLSIGLLKIGLNAHNFTPEDSDKIGIISNNRPAWLITDLAAQQIGVIVIPLYPTTSLLELEFILNESQVKYVFVNNVEMYEKIKSLQSKLTHIKNIYTFDNINNTPHYSDLIHEISEADMLKLNSIKSSIPTHHLPTIIYTSGTTGTPKGVMLTHKNICSNILAAKLTLPFVDNPNGRILSFLPLNHIFEKVASYIFMYSGISIYFAESIENISVNLLEVKPTAFTTVPRLLEKVFEKIMEKGNALTGIKKWLFDWSIKLAEKYDCENAGSLFYQLQLSIANKLIFKKWREALGGDIEFIITGGAACQVKLLRIFNAANIPVYEGYGPTENSPVVSVNTMDKDGRKFGTVGLVAKGVTVKIADDGEILVTGPCVMKGYFKRPELTAETIVDGWLHTGDIGEFIGGKFLKITDRKKELFKTSGGKYVAPQPIENTYKENPFIEQIMIVGADKKFVSALIVPNFIYLKKWLLKNQIGFFTNQDIVQNKEVIDLYNNEIFKIASKFNHIEQIKKMILLPNEWTVDTGELTPKMSLKRKNILEKYKTDIENMYK
ncbi:MAG: long-chain fatty acid--CoA ligase [Sediminibacterium sp.]|nr:long-chain fatty acid--CoA ligase [Sediminibacterium sp.]